jgi:NTP pyrophosphatase (non-canonical NTP hydrolase)
MAMEERLRANDHKGGWDNCEPEWLLTRLRQEVEELAAEIAKGGTRSFDADRLRLEAADVGNFAMMIADVLGTLKEP